jgi:MFS family permease
MNRARKNVVLLALCQALAMTSVTILFTVAALIGNALAADRSLATLPLAMLQLAVMLTTIPASLLMRRIGRRSGFAIGTGIGMIGAGLAVLAVLIKSFPLFCLATVLFGIFNGFSGFYRFAAADSASEAFRAQAISLVIAGGVVAALTGPSLASWAKDWFASAVFAGSLLPIMGLQVLTLGLLKNVDIPPLSAIEQQNQGRSLSHIMQQPVFLVAVLGSMVGYGSMALLMTATPLAMTEVHHPFHTAASVIQWHVLGMFAPSFFTGFLIVRFGVLTIVVLGVVLNLLCVVTNLSGTGVEQFRLALTLLGIGWNFMFVGSTTLLTQAYMPTEKAKTQAMHDFFMFGCVAVAAFLSGNLLNGMGWKAVNYATVPGLLLVLLAVLWLRRQQQRITPEPLTPMALPGQTGE